MSDFLNNLQNSARDKTLANMRAALEATQKKMNEQQKNKFNNGLLKSVTNAAKVALAGGSVAAFSLAAMHGLDSVLAAAEHTMTTGQYAAEAASATRAALKSALGGTLVGASLVAAAYNLHNMSKKNMESSNNLSSNGLFVQLQNALQSTGAGKVLDAPETYSPETLNDAVLSCIEHLSHNSDVLEFANEWGNSLITKQENNNKMRFA
ncbi:hypothetical protein [Vibrio sp. D431a]|uniref:hypothetical protein n=1 Tax=Vibrio sp. D431a TaxID=2837388 RepID=UPI002553BB72|nr:hypothetical protein [Vibrio sp. D431a]MDK9793251.1 hypothetical protein [Vibrio sp. D431a]